MGKNPGTLSTYRFNYQRQRTVAGIHMYQVVPDLWKHGIQPLGLYNFRNAGEMGIIGDAYPYSIDGDVPEEITEMVRQRGGNDPTMIMGLERDAQSLHYGTRCRINEPFAGLPNMPVLWSDDRKVPEKQYMASVRST